MRYVIIRDDDTNAATPVECLERLYRPALDCGMPINLATIPEVSLNARNGDGDLEGFLRFRNGSTESTLPIGSNAKIVNYLKANRGYEIAQHGLHHDYREFEQLPPETVDEALTRGTKLLRESGFDQPKTFVAPHDKFSPVSLRKVASHFPIVSSGWYELQRLPRAWWPAYAWKKATNSDHWHVGNTLLLTHPGCLLSCFRNYNTSLELILKYITSQRLTVLVTHWWEYFRDGTPDEPFIAFLHETINFLATNPEIKVIRFSDLLSKSSTP
jgi:hypothetical protein